MIKYKRGGLRYNKFVQCSSFLVYIADSCNQQQHRLFSCSNTEVEIFRITAGNVKFWFRFKG